MSEGKSRQKFVRFQAFITPTQRAFLGQDADDRYPLGEKQRRNLSPALRDALDFWHAHYPLFLTWIATRGNQPPKV